MRIAAADPVGGQGRGDDLWLGQAEVGAGVADAVEARLGERLDPGVVGPGVPEAAVTGGGQVLGLQPPGALLGDVHRSGGPAAVAEQGHGQLDAGGLQRLLLGVVELLEGDDRGRGDGLPDVGDRAPGGAGVGDEREPSLAEGVRQALQQVTDAGSDRPVGQQQQDDVGSPGDQGAGRRRRGVAQLGGRVPYPLPGGLGDDLMRSVVQHVADRGPGHPGMSRRRRPPSDAATC